VLWVWIDGSARSLPRLMGSGATGLASAALGVGGGGRAGGTTVAAERRVGGLLGVGGDGEFVRLNAAPTEVNPSRPWLRKMPAIAMTATVPTAATHCQRRVARDGGGPPRTSRAARRIVAPSTRR